MNNSYANWRALKKYRDDHYVDYDYDEVYDVDYDDVDDADDDGDNPWKGPFRRCNPLIQALRLLFPRLLPLQHGDDDDTNSQLPLQHDDDDDDDDDDHDMNSNLIS